MEESGLYVGDVVYVGRDDEYAVGDVVAFYRAPELYDEPFEKEAVRGREIWIHQIVAVRTDENGRSSFLTKGTSNAADDGYYVPQDYVIGKASALPAFIGGLIGFLATSTGIICLIVLPCAVMLIYLIWDLIMLLTMKEEPLKSAAAAECVSGAEEKLCGGNLTKACPEPLNRPFPTRPPPPQAGGRARNGGRRGRRAGQNDGGRTERGGIGKNRKPETGKKMPRAETARQAAAGTAELRLLRKGGNMVGKFTKIRLILTAILAFITAAVLSFAVFAATNVRLTGSGGLEYEASGEQPPDPVTPPTDEEAEKQEKRLTNSGFVVEKGKIDQLQPSQESLWEKTPKDMNYALRAVKEENGQLVPTGEKPILSYAIYDGAVCDYVNELVHNFGFFFFLYYVVWKLFYGWLGLCYMRTIEQS